MQYIAQLQLELENFELVRAETLSVMIHKAESLEGYNVSPAEEELWYELTVKIQEHYSQKGQPMSDLMTSTIIDGVVELMRIPAYSTPSKALHEYMVRQEMFKGRTIHMSMAMNSQVILLMNLQDLNVNLSYDEARVFSFTIEKADDDGIALMAMTNALEFDNG